MSSFKSAFTSPFTYQEYTIKATNLLRSCIKKSAQHAANKQAMPVATVNRLCTPLAIDSPIEEPLLGRKNTIFAGITSTPAIAQPLPKRPHFPSLSTYGLPVTPLSMATVRAHEALNSNSNKLHQPLYATLARGTHKEAGRSVVKHEKIDHYCTSCGYNCTE